MKRISLLFSALCLLCSGTELTDLGQGLSYLRIHSVAESSVALRKAVPGAGALVLDLRYATAAEDSPAALQSALAERPAGTTLFILVSPATPASLGPVITTVRALTLGAPGSAPAPKVIVQTDAPADRRAYDALEAGTALTTLIAGKIEKERYDEATLVHEFKNGLPASEPPLTPDPAAAKPAATPEKEKEKPAPLTDRVLQRAVHLHRALLALKSR